MGCVRTAICRDDGRSACLFPRQVRTIEAAAHNRSMTRGAKPCRGREQMQAMPRVMARNSVEQALVDKARAATDVESRHSGENVHHAGLLRFTSSTVAVRFGSIL